MGFDRLNMSMTKMRREISSMFDMNFSCRRFLRTIGYFKRIDIQMIADLSNLEDGERRIALKCNYFIHIPHKWRNVNALK